MEHNRRNFLRSVAAIVGTLSPCCHAWASSFGWANSESIGASLDQGLREAYIVLNDGELYARLRRVLNKLTSHLGMNAADIELCVLIDPNVNALATGGGRMFLFSGMLDFCSSERDLAAVMAHELIHIKNDHLSKRIIEAKATGAIAVVATVAGSVALSSVLRSAYGPVAPYTPNPQPQIGQLSLQLSSPAVETLNTLSNVGYSREQEYEADAGAIDALKGAGFESQCLRDLLARMNTYTGQHNDVRTVEAVNKPSQGALNGHWLNSANVSIAERIARLG